MKKKNREGFTLIEAIIYSVLIAIIIGYSLGGVYSLIQGSTQLNNLAVIDEEANFLLKKIEWVLESAETIVLPISGSTGTALNVNKYNSSINPVSFNLNSGNLRMSTGGGSNIILNNDRTVVTNLTFQHIAPNLLSPDGVRASLSLNGRSYSMTTYLNR